MKSLAEHLGIDISQPTLPEAIAPAVDLTGMTARQLSMMIITSPEYRLSVWNRIRLGTLPPQVECRFLDHALGKPVEHLEVKDTTLEHLTIEELEQQALELVALARQLRENSQTDLIH